MKIIFIITVLLIILINTGVMAEQRNSDIQSRDGVIIENDPSTDETPRYNLQIFMRVHKVVFEQDEPILIQFYVKNQETKTIDLKIADMFFLNFSFIVKNIQNQMIGEKNDYYLFKIDNKNNRNFRTVKLAPGDMYGKTINLSDLFSFDKVGYYIIQGHFYPVPYGFHDVINYPSNSLRINIRYPERRMEVARRISEQEKAELEKPRSPSETIDFMLNSRLKKQWNHFFKFIDLARLIEIYPDFQKEYSAIPPSRRGALMERFRNFLKNYLEEQMISFDTFRSVITREDAIVYTNIIYKHTESTFKKRYVFRLYKRGNHWYLYHFYVMNLRLTSQEYETEIEKQQEQLFRERESSSSSIPVYD